MFYSPQILGDSKSGVSTIWLFATVGKTNHRQLTRKAIQKVDVPQACKTIIDPGAPLALRLQGNLLYGVSRVFSQQCHYVLSDAEKTQSDMLTFFRVMATSELDPKAGKAKRHQITLQDDPNFDIMNVFADFSINKELFTIPSQDSTQSMSQLTPFTQQSLSSGRDPTLLPFDFVQSSIYAGSPRLRSDLGQNSPYPMEVFHHLGEEEIDPFAGIGLEVDGDGNIVEIAELEPELPPLPGLDTQDIEMGGVTSGKNTGIFGGDNVLILGEDPLPDAVPFHKRRRTRKSSPCGSSSTDTTLEQRAVAPQGRGRPRKVPQMVDSDDRVSRQEFRSWSKDYLENMDACRKGPRAATRGQARKNAAMLLFGNGIANIGTLSKATGLAHPLAEHFSGASLQAQLNGKYPEEHEEQQRGQRRSSAEAFEDEEEEGRRVRQRPGDDSKFGQNLGNELVPEIGMDAAPPMEDYHSSSMVQGSRPPSVLGSMIRGPESAQKGQPDPSPLFRGDKAIDPVRRYSDLPGSVHGSDDFPQLHSQDYSVEDGVYDFSDNALVQQNSKELARDRGQTRLGDHPRCRWVDFEEIAIPDGHKKRFAAHTFLHVLTLLSRDQIKVEQEGIAEHRPFGTMRLGFICDPETE
ncbi:Rec8 like protein-domain-containing protein [Thelonectria olida]|uniref:Rec8 like protein-domain-containing protein n=1 Tax=Thelonectria olida TaxID=1576542 RepID=A0A9P9ANE4_9HYPO|nr:Rec8 like protein-domain-containing protein [Thelonectria olida]